VASGPEIVGSYPGAGDILLCTILPERTATPSVEFEKLRRLVIWAVTIVVYIERDKHESERQKDRKTERGGDSSLLATLLQLYLCKQHLQY